MTKTKNTVGIKFKRGITFAGLFLFFYFSISPTFAIASTNVALATNGGTVIAFSKQFDSRGYAAYLIDGKKQFNVAYTGWWVKAPTGTQYATLQFNNTYTIDKINHFNDGQYGAKAVTIKYSLDNLTWQTLGTYTGLTVTSSRVNLNTFSFSPIQAKYLKFEYTSFNSSSWLQIDEIEALTAEPALPDTTPPTGTIKINNDSQYTNSTTVTLNLSAQDNTGGSGLSQMQFSNDNTTWSIPEAYATTKAWTLTTGDGTKTIYVKYKDVAGNWSSAYSDTIILDTTPPTVSITSPLNNSTLSGTVNIQATASDNVAVAKVAFYLDTTLLAEDTTSPYSYTLNSTLYANGTHTLKAVASDNAGNSATSSITVNISNQIQNSTNVALATNGGTVIAFSKQFDSRGYAAYLIDGKKQFNVAYTGWWVKAPTGTQYATLQFNNTYTIDKINHFNDGQYGAKAVTIKYSLDNLTWQTLGTYTGLTVTSSRVNLNTFSFNPIQAKYLKFEYTSFNSSSWLQINEVEAFTAAISVPADTTAPTGTIKINNDSAYTNSTLVTLNLSAQDNTGGSGLSQMQFSNDNTTWSIPEAYATTKAWTLTTGDGTKTIYVKYKDVAGNWSTPVSDTIILDTTPPLIIIASPVNAATLPTNSVQLEGTIDGIVFSESRTLTEGENTLTKTATDLAGNTASASVTVYYYSGTLIGPQGGEVTSSDGKVKLIIPSGALTENQNIKILRIDNASIAENALPSNTALLTVAEFKPYGLVFAKPVEIIYTLDKPEIPGTEVELGIYDSLQNKITPLGHTTTVLSDGYTIRCSFLHFSTYAALKSLVSSGSPIGGGVKIPLPDMFTGSFSNAIPITVSPGRKGMQPGLGLTYRSSNPNSWVGLGFSLNPGYITRSTKLGPPTYNDTQDTFYFVTDGGTTELVHLIDNLYQAKIESSFTKFFKETDDSWRVVGKEGGLLKLGQTTDSKEGSSLGTFSWYLTKAVDTNGNYIEYYYSKDQGKSYLSRIDYTGNEMGISPTNSVEFFLEPRIDIASSYITSSKIATAKRLKEIQVKVNYDLVWRYVLEYAYSPDTDRSLLKSITQYASDNKNLPTQKFTYQSAK